MSERLDVEVTPYALPFRETYRAAPGSIRQRELVLLSIRDENGLEGLGEAVPLSLRGGAGLETVVDALEGWASRKSTAAPLPAGGPARCAVACALADLEAKRLGVPLWDLLGGGGDPSPVRCNATIGAGPVAEVSGRAGDLAAAGFTRIKLKVGMPGDVDLVEGVRNSVGSEVLLRLDANGAWSPTEAIAFLEMVGPESIELLEQPAPDLEGLARVRASVGVAVVADESVTSPDQALEAARIGACDAATVKISKVGGLDGTLGGYIPTYLSSALDGPVGIAAAGHLASTMASEGPTGPVFHGLATGDLFDGTIATVEARMEADRLVLPEGPGLGVELDRAALERFRL